MGAAGGKWRFFVSCSGCPCQAQPGWGHLGDTQKGWNAAQLGGNTVSPSPGREGGAALLGRGPCSSLGALKAPAELQPGAVPSRSCGLSRARLGQLLEHRHPWEGLRLTQCSSSDLPESAWGDELGFFPTVSPLVTPTSTCHFKKQRRKVTL